MNQLFFNIEHKNQDKILRNIEALSLTFKKDSQILSNVKWDDVICLVRCGNIQILRIDYNGNQTIIEDLKENSIFGTFISSINSSEYEILAKTDTELIVIDYNNITTLLSKNRSYYSNQFIINVLELFYEKIKEKNERLEVLSKKSIRDKLLAYFDLLSKKQLSKNITLPFSLTFLADYISIDRSAMMREMKNLRDDGLIEGKGRKIKLHYQAY